MTRNRITQLLSVLTIAMALMATPQTTRAQEDNEEIPICYEGGRGITQCTYGGVSNFCAIICSPGYYACCNGWSCKCFRD